MKKILLPLVLLVTFGFISGCANNLYGVPQSQWNAMTPPQQKIAMRNYFVRQRLQDHYNAEVMKNKEKYIPPSKTINGVISSLPSHSIGYHYNYTQRHADSGNTCIVHGKKVPCSQMPKRPIVNAQHPELWHH